MPYQIERAILEAIRDCVPYTVIGFEPDGGIVACIQGPHGRYWVEL